MCNVLARRSWLVIFLIQLGFETVEQRISFCRCWNHAEPPHSSVRNAHARPNRLNPPGSIPVIEHDEHWARSIEIMAIVFGNHIFDHSSFRHG